jgi:outer membrane receptor protein involved in Fe transport
MANIRSISPLLGCGACVLLVTSETSVAQIQSADATLGEVIVTAQKRAENLQTVPISIDAITGATLENLGDKDFFDYASTVANLAVGIGTGAGGNGSGYGVSSSRSVTIRGVAGDNTTAFYLNDTPLPLSLDPRVLDLERVEVLRGPQGTLFGQGSMGGAVRLITRQPALDQTSGKVEADGSYVNDGGGGYSVNGTLNLPLVSNEFGLRISAFSAFEPGYFEREWGVATLPNVVLPPGAPQGSKPHVGSTQETGGSMSLAIAPSALPGLTVTPMIMYQRANSNGYPLADYTPDNLVQVRPLDVPEAVTDTWTFAGLTVNYAADYGRFVGSGTYFYRTAFDLEDGTEVSSGVYFGFPHYVAAPLPNTLDTKTWTGEVRFESSLAGPVQFVVGAFADLTERLYEEKLVSPGANAASGYTLGTDLLYQEFAPNTDRQRAIFADVSYDITSALQVSAGLRRAYLAHEYTDAADGALNGGPSFASGAQSEYTTTPRYTARYLLAPNQMLYASAAKGFRIGGQNYPLPSVCAADLAAAGLSNGSDYGSDSLWSYEVGTKNAWLDHHLNTRVAAYHIDWKAIQQSTLLNCGFEVTTNSGAAVSNGGEFEADVALKNLTVNLSLGYEDAKITETAPGSLTVVGQPLSGVPKWSGSTTVQYSVPFGERTGFLRGQFTAVGDRTSYNNLQTGRDLAAYRLLKLRTGFDQGPLELALYCDNVFDTRGNLGDLIPESGELPGRPRWMITTPRTIGLHLRHNF